MSDSENKKNKRAGVPENSEPAPPAAPEKSIQEQQLQVLKKMLGAQTEVERLSKKQNFRTTVFLGILAGILVYMFIGFLTMRTVICKPIYEFWNRHADNSNDMILSANMAAYGYWHPWMVEIFFSNPPTNLAVFPLVYMLITSKKLEEDVTGDAERTETLKKSGYPMRCLVGDGSACCVHTTTSDSGGYDIFPFVDDACIACNSNFADETCENKENMSCRGKKKGVICVDAFEYNLMGYIWKTPGEFEDWPEFIQKCIEDMDGGNSTWLWFKNGGLYQVAANLDQNLGAISMWTYFFTNPYDESNAETCENLKQSSGMTLLSNTMSMGVMGGMGGLGFIQPVTNAQGVRTTGGYGMAGAIAAASVGAGFGLTYAQNKSESDRMKCGLKGSQLFGFG